MLSGSTLLLLAACGGEQPTPEANTEPVEQIDETDQTPGSEYTTTDEGTADSTSTGETTSQGIETRYFEYTLDDAVRTFFDTYPEAEDIDKVEFDVNDGRFESEINGFNAAIELRVDAETGEIRGQCSEKDDDTNAGIILPKDHKKRCKLHYMIQIARRTRKTSYEHSLTK